MEEVIKTDILAVLKKTIDAIESQAGILSKQLSNEVIHNASIYQDEHSTSVSIILYSIGKIIENEGDVDYEILKLLKDAYSSLRNDDVDHFNADLKDMMNLIEESDFRAKTYFKHVLNSARIKKGAKIFDHGITSKQTAELLGRSQWEMVNYIGKTNIADSFGLKDNMNKRLAYARKLFRGI